ncbi:response regulator [bacterium]|nr:response regulator [bacterium]
MKTVKIIDDDPTLRDSLSKYFLFKKYKISNDYFNPANLDIYLIDYDLSKDNQFHAKNGFEFLKKILSKNHNIITIMMTQYSQLSLIERSFLEDADFFISKPFKMEELENIIKTLYKNRLKKKLNEQKKIVKKIGHIESEIFFQLKDQINNKLTVILLTLDILDNDENYKDILIKDIKEISQEIDKMEQKVKMILKKDKGDINEK